MTAFRFALSVIALAVCHLSLAQQPEGAAVSGESATGGAVDASQVTTPDVGATKAQTAQPRYLRGNDQVIAPPKTVQRLDGAPLTFNFEEAPVAEVVRTILSDILKAPYVLHPPISGTVTLASRSSIPPDQAVFLLESALQANGLALLRDARGTYHVGRPDMLKGIGGAIRQVGRTGDPLPPGYGAIIVPLQYIGAGEMANILRPMASPEAIVRVDNVRNLLVLSGTRTQAEGWLDIVNTFDVNLLKGMSVGVFPLKHASIQEVETALRLVSGGGAPAVAAAGGAVAATTAPAAAPGGAAAPGAGGAGAAMLGEGNPLFGALRIMPIERLNSILVVTPRAAYLEEARRWIEKLDQPSDNGAEPQLHIYKVQNGNARHLASVLSGIFGGTGAPTPVANSGVAPGLTSGSFNSFGQALVNSGYNNFNAGGGLAGGGFNRQGNAFGGGSLGGGGQGFGSGIGGQGRGQQNQAGLQGQGVVATNLGGVRVMADELNNSILVWSNRAEFQKIEATLKRLDLPPTQVLIDAAIIEVTLDDSLNYGLQWAFDGGVGGGYQGLGQLSSNGKPVAALTGTLAGAAAQGFTYSLTNSANQIRLALSALATKTSVKMISNPSLMVLDNHTAQMAVGNQVPVRTATTSYINNTDATTTTVQYRDTGVNLSVTPSVNAGNLVTMQIDQTVTDTVGGSGSSDTQPVFLQRQISSKVAVRTGETIVLGGLIKDGQSREKSGLPILQDLPLVGNLFGTNGRTGARTELLVVITPRVARTDPEIREVSEELRDRLKGLQAFDLKAQRGVGATAAQESAATMQPLQAQ